MTHSLLEQANLHAEREAEGWQGFVNPSRVHRTVPLWSWTGDVDPDEAVRQLDGFAEAGLGGTVIHARAGLTTPFLGDRWFETVEAVLARSARHGMEVWLYDELGYPSGFAGGAVPRADEAFRHKALIARPPGVEPPAGCTVLWADEDLVVYRWVSPLGHAMFEGACYADTLNGAAIERFIECAYEPYRQRFARYIPDTLSTAFTDEPVALTHANAPHGAVPFTDALLTDYEHRYGEDPLPRLRLLFADHADAPRFRLRYDRLVNERFARTYTRQLAAWCREAGMTFTGHFDCEHDLFKQQLRGVRVMPQYRDMDMPGIDHLGLQVSETLTALQCASAAAQAGQRRIMSEVFGCAGHGLTAADRLWIARQQLTLGVNRFVPHLLAYTIEGDAKRDNPPVLSAQSPWWPASEAWETPIARRAAALSQGEPDVGVGVLHPGESVAALWCASHDENDPGNAPGPHYEPTRPGVRDRVRAIQTSLESITRALLEAQVGFHLLDEQLLADHGEVLDSPRLRIGRMHYRHILVPEMLTIRQSTLTLLERFAAHGGTVEWCGRPPRYVDGADDHPALKRLPGDVHDGHRSVVDALAGRQPTRWVAPDDDAPRPWLHARRLPGAARLIYLFNRDRSRQACGALRFVQLPGEVWRLDPDDGTQDRVPIDTAGDTVDVSVTLPPGGDRLFYVSSSSPPEPLPLPERPRSDSSVSHTDAKAIDWRVCRLDPNTVRLDRFRLKQRDGRWSSPCPLAAWADRIRTERFTEPLMIQADIDVRSEITGLVQLAMEQPTACSVWLNHTPIHDRFGTGFFIDRKLATAHVSDLLTTGRHTLTIRFPAGRPVDRAPEPVFMFGAFRVPVEEIFEVDAMTRVSLPVPAVEAERSLAIGDVTQQGLPFYTGRLSLEATAPAAAHGQRLRCPGLRAAVAEVRYAGQHLGWLTEPPFEIDLPASTQPAPLELILYGTLRNVFGPFQHPGRDPVACAPGVFQATDDALPTAPIDWETRYTLQPFGCCEPPMLGHRAAPRLKSPKSKA